jgi:hypothetical protein
MGLLGGIDQQKEESESASGDRALLGRQRIDFKQQVVERWSAGLSVTAGTRCGAQALDYLKGFFPFQSLNHSSEGAGEPTDIVVEGQVLLSRGHGHSR